jgi:hypothetical protein
MSPPQIKKLLFIISIFLIFILILLSTSINPLQYSGIIEKTNYNQDSISFYLKNLSIQFIIFTNKFIMLKENQQIKIQGKLEVYKNKTQVLVDKIALLQE